LFETDSSCCGEEDDQNNDNEKISISSENILTADGQGKDIVAGSPTKLGRQ
jgi:hypothetical protein